MFSLGCSGYNPTTMAYFNRTDWQYIHTNGAQGTVPPANATNGEQVSVYVLATVMHLQ
jgi:hypothetical protein